jgi:phosphopantetheine--protein transferase-like protein
MRRGADPVTGALRVGTDLVQVSRIAQSIHQFGDRFVHRLFTADEIAYASSNPALLAERLAARFAAKEAAIKALSLSDTGLDWRQIEVQRSASGHCSLALHGVAERSGSQGANHGTERQSESRWRLRLGGRRCAGRTCLS